MYINESGLDQTFYDSGNPIRIPAGGFVDENTYPQVKSLKGFREATNLEVSPPSAESTSTTEGVSLPEDPDLPKQQTAGTRGIVAPPKAS